MESSYVDEHNPECNAKMQTLPSFDNFMTSYYIEPKTLFGLNKEKIKICSESTPTMPRPNALLPKKLSTMKPTYQTTRNTRHELRNQLHSKFFTPHLSKSLSAVLSRTKTNNPGNQLTATFP